MQLSNLEIVDNSGCQLTPDASIRDIFIQDCREPVAPEPPKEVWKNPDGTIKWDEAFREAKGYLTERADDPKRNLTDAERTVMKRVGAAILDNDTAQLERVLRSYQPDPQNLQRAMWALAEDMKGAGIVLDYRIAWQSAAANTGGLLRVHTDNSNSYLELSTHPKTQTEIRGPVVSMSDPHAERFFHLERRGDYLYDDQQYSGVKDFMTERAVFALRLYEMQHGAKQK